MLKVHSSEPKLLQLLLSKISDQNNWEGPEQKIKLRGGGAKF